MAPGWQSRVSAEAEPTLVKVARSVMHRAERNMSRHVRTGALLRSLNQAGTRVIVGTDHWPYVEYGTRPHTIRVSKKKVLSDGVTVYGRVVRHPGNREFQPMRNALGFVSMADLGGFVSSEVRR